VPGSVADGEEGGDKGGGDIEGGDIEGGDEEGSGGSGPRGGGMERVGGRRGGRPGPPWGDRGTSKGINSEVTHPGVSPSPVRCMHGLFRTRPTTSHRRSCPPGGLFMIFNFPSSHVKLVNYFVLSRKTSAPLPHIAPCAYYLSLAPRSLPHRLR
jgi:hypothetical protein